MSFFIFLIDAHSVGPTELYSWNSRDNPEGVRRPASLDSLSEFSYYLSDAGF